jgi:hypothetical protein
MLRSTMYMPLAAAKSTLLPNMVIGKIICD